MLGKVIYSLTSSFNAVFSNPLKGGGWGLKNLEFCYVKSSHKETLEVNYYIGTIWRIMENMTLFSEIEIHWSLGEGRFFRVGSKVIFDDMEKRLVRLRMGKRWSCRVNWASCVWCEFLTGSRSQLSSWEYLGKRRFYNYSICLLPKCFSHRLMWHITILFFFFGISNTHMAGILASFLGTQDIKKGSVLQITLHDQRHY